jgi:hypothetical protein
MKDLEYKKILQDSSSFQLVRTNPKLTSNIKFTVNEAGNMWLNSIDVISNLTNDIYKKFPIDVNLNHPTNIFRFFDSGKTPSELAFAYREHVSKTTTSKDYKDQFDFSHYFSGARYLPSKEYEERLSYFAPLYLKKSLPDYFVIFKVKDPMNYKIDVSVSNYPYDKETFMKDMFRNSTIIKTFDLRESTKVGLYLRKYLSDPNFPISPLTVDFQEDAFTQFNGILMDSGAFGSRSEILDDFYSRSSPLKHFEQNITNGFERNGIIYPNIFNMEFIFNDDTSEIYDFNRYVGFYVNTIELEKLKTDIERPYIQRKTWQNTPSFRREIKENEDIIIEQENTLGVEYPYRDTSLTMSEFESSFDDKDNFYMNYITDRDNKLYSFNLGDLPVIPDIDSLGTELDTGIINLSNTEIDLGKFIGPGITFMQDDGFVSNNKGHSNGYIKILSELNNLDVIKFYHPNGTRDDVNGKYDEFTATIGYANAPNPGDFYYFNDLNDVNGSDTFYFNATGEIEEIASAINGCLNEVSHRSYKTVLMNQYVFVKVAASGDHDDKFAFEFSSDLGIYDNIEIKETTGSDLISNILTFAGGSKYGGNRLIADATNRTKLQNNISNLLVKTTEGWSKVIKISNYVDTINEANSLTGSSRSSSINDYFDKIAIVLEEDQRPEITYKEFNINLLHNPSFGFLSFLPIRDFDFNFYNSEYLNFPINDLYKFYYIPENVDLLVPGEIYEVYGQGSIVYEGMVVNSGNTFTVNIEKSYSVESGNPVVSFKNVDLSGTIGSSIVPINDQNEELKDFEGFFLLKDPSKVVPDETDEAFARKQRYLNGIASTEYDFYKENYTKDFALVSKMIPYITKWSLLNGRDSRNNPYRLNTELMFGFNNFSPSHDDTTQNPSNFTHEWYFLESSFDYVNTEQTIKLNNSYFEEALDLTKLLEEKDYFVNYFTYTPTLNGEEVGETQTRYSIINKNQANEFETFIKGFKSMVRDVIDPNDIGADGKPIFNPNSNRFEDYKFSSLLRFVKEDINKNGDAPVSYKYIEHKDFKFILLLIEVRINDLNNVDEVWKTLDAMNSIEYGGVVTPQFSVSGAPGDDNFLLTPDSGTLGEMYNSINGDYKVNYGIDPISGFDISDATYAFLYSMKHKKYNNLLDNFSNIKLSSKLDISASGFDPVTMTIEKMDSPVLTNYPSSLKDEINVINSNTFIMPRFLTTNTDFFVDEAIGIIPQHTSRMVSIQNNSVNLETNNSYVLIDETGALSSSLPSFIPSSVFLNFYIFKVMTGGGGYYEKLFEKISFATFKRYVNELNPIIEYLSYSLDNSGSPVLSSSPNYYLDIPSVESITKTTGLVTLPDENKPSNYSFSDIIGYDYYESDLDNTYDINRYRGEYEPIFNDVMFFNSKYSFVDNNISDINLGNISFNINVNLFGEIQDFAHIKIADTKILDLEANDQFEPVYELINEIAIGKENYFLLDSNWDYGFHFKYTNKIDYSPVAGTLRIEEDDSFIGKLIILPEVIELENFDIILLDETVSLDTVNLDNIEIVAKEESDSLKGYININNVLTRYLMEDGITQKFNEYLVNEEIYLGPYDSIDSYVKEYIKINILKLFELDDLQFYSKLDRELISNLENPINLNSIEFRFLTDKERFEQSYSINKNLEINKFKRLILEFNFRKIRKSGMLVSPKIKIKFI